MNVKKVSIDQLPELWEQQAPGFYYVELTSKEMVEPKDGSEFSKKNYYDNPENYTSIFHEKYLKYFHVLVNCHHHDSRYPKLITKS